MKDLILIFFSMIMVWLWGKKWCFLKCIFKQLGRKALTSRICVKILLGKRLRDDSDEASVQRRWYYWMSEKWGLIIQIILYSYMC